MGRGKGMDKTEKIISIALLSIIAVGIFIRFLGLRYGLPMPLASDEEVTIGGTLRMLEQRTLIPALNPEVQKILYYPLGLIYLYMAMFVPYIGSLYVVSGLPPLTDFAPIVFDHLSNLWTLARLTSALISVATLWVIYKLGKSLFDSHLAALSATALLASDFTHAFFAHFARHWEATTLCIWLTVYFGWKYWLNPQRKFAIAAGVTSGYGFAVSFIGALGFGAPILALLALTFQKRLNIKHAAWLVGALALISGVFTALFPAPLQRLLYSGILPLQDAKTVTGWLDTTGYYALSVWYADPALVVLSMLGLLMLAVHRRWYFLVISLGGLLFYALLLYKFLPLEDRYIMPILPLLALLGGYAISYLIQIKVVVVRNLATTAAIAAVMLSLAISSQSSLMLSRDDTRLQATAWIENNLSEEKVVLDLNGIKMIPSPEAITAQQKLDPNSLSSLDRYILKYSEKNGRAPVMESGASVYVIHPWKLTGDIRKGVEQPEYLDVWRAKGYSYYAVEHRDADHDTPIQNAVRATGKLVASFYPGPQDIVPPYLRSTVLITRPMTHLFQLDRFGTQVDIYRIDGK